MSAPQEADAVKATGDQADRSKSYKLVRSETGEVWGPCCLPRCRALLPHAARQSDVGGE